MSAKAPVGQPIDVNASSAESLSAGVVGLGPVLSGRIVSYREEHGPFTSISELAKVQGIGPRLLARIADQVTVGEQQPLVVHAITRREESPDAGDLGTRKAAEEGTAVEQALEKRLAEEADLSTVESKMSTGEEGKEAQPLPRNDTSPKVEEAPSIAPLKPNAVSAKGTLNSVSGEPAHELPPQPIEKRDLFWQRLLPVALGGVLGMVLTLLAMLVISGTLRFAPKREVVSLSRNLEAMRSEQERAWQRIEQLTGRTDELERQLRRLEALSERVANLEKDLIALRADARELERAFETLQRDVSQELSRLDRRVVEMQNTVQRIQERVRRFDAFFASLRDLLDELQDTSLEPDMPSAPAR